MNIFAKHDQSTWERSLQIMQNRWVAHLTNEVSVCKTWYTMMMIVNKIQLDWRLSTSEND